ncbi:hypothetical protein [Chryseobacterium sp.]|uniref:hypothetical protein n=1 Tax=Chryseobacterium sp. TaxID=1871047 RepID=UPI0025BA31E3|nr:hypothetical protein [Chryseobacterium sp.]
MKTFFKCDFYIQLILLLVISCVVLIDLNTRNGDLLILFYFGVGIPQLISYLIRLSHSGNKSLLFKIYGLFIIPVYPSFLGLVLFGNTDVISMICLIFPILAFFYSPVMAVLYVIDCYREMKKKTLVYNRYQSIRNEKLLIQNTHETSF